MSTLQRRFDDNATYLVNDKAKLIYNQPNAFKQPESGDSWWDWLTFWGGSMNCHAERYVSYQFTDRIDVTLAGESVPARLVQLTLF